METIGFVGVGRIGLPICRHLIESGVAVVGYRRSSLAEFVASGGIAARSAAEVGARADIVFTCLPGAAALDEVLCGPSGLLGSARPGQVVVELGSHPLTVKRAYVDRFAARGAHFIDGEVSGTPGMVVARTAYIYLAGDAAAASRAEQAVRRFADLCLYLGEFGAATKVKLVNNLLVGVHIAGAAQAMALGLRLGIEPSKLIEAVAKGSGGSTQFAIRAPWMAEQRFMPQQGSIQAIAYYLGAVRDAAAETGLATDFIDSLAATYAAATPVVGDRDVSAIFDHFARSH
jgi:3-hydroxyisobutyrate dehydrogenase